MTGIHLCMKLCLALAALAAVVAAGGGSAVAQEAPRLDFPSGLATDGRVLYVANGRNHTIGQIDLAGRSLAVIAGKTFESGSNDGVGTEARFSSPSGMVLVGTDLYIVDTRNSDVRKMNTATRQVTTVAGTANIPGTQDGRGNAAHFNLPAQIAYDGRGMLYITDTYNNTVRSFQISDGMVKTIAGQAGIGGDADGAAGESQFNLPTGIAADGNAVYVADTGNDKIKKIDPITMETTTIAGTGEEGRADGPGAQAQFNSPKAMVLSGTTLYILDSDNHLVRKLDTTTNVVTTLSHLTGHIGSGCTLSSDGRQLYVSDTTENSVQQVDTGSGQFVTLYPPS